MEYAPGGDLAALIARRAEARPLRLFPEARVVAWFLQLARGLAHVHVQGVLHRDVKCSNVFLSDDTATALLGDFGVSKALGADTRFATTAIGTPYYLSPEVCDEKPYDAKSDIWSLGCVVYEMAALRRAFDGKSLPALVRRILKSEYPPLPRTYSAALRQLVASMLNRDPRLRPTAARIVAQLEAHPSVLHRHHPRDVASCPTTPRDACRSPAEPTKPLISLPQTLLPSKVHRKEPLVAVPRMKKVGPRSEAPSPRRGVSPGMLRVPGSPRARKGSTTTTASVPPLPPSPNEIEEHGDSTAAAATQRGTPRRLGTKGKQKRVSQERRREAQVHEEHFRQKLRTVKARVSLADPPFGGRSTPDGGNADVVLESPRRRQSSPATEEGTFRFAIAPVPTDTEVFPVVHEASPAAAHVDIPVLQQLPTVCDPCDYRTPPSPPPPLSSSSSPPLQPQPPVHTAFESALQSAPQQQAEQQNPQPKPAEEHLRRALENLQRLDQIIKSFADPGDPPADAPTEKAPAPEYPDVTADDGPDEEEEYGDSEEENEGSFEEDDEEEEDEDAVGTSLEEGAMVEELRETLEAQLGEATFRRAHDFLQQHGGAAADDATLATLEELFGVAAAARLSQLLRLETALLME